MKNTVKGWFFSLSKDSDWGDATTFNEQMIADCEIDDNGFYTIEADVWGTVDASQGLPERGDGIAFYHSSGAFYSGFDYWGKKRRIQMYGVIEDIELEKKNLKNIKFRIDNRTSQLLRIIPLIRDDSTEYFFNEIIQQHKVYSLYPVNSNLWSEFLRLVSTLHTQNNITNTVELIKNSYLKKNTILDRLRIAEDLSILGASYDSLYFYEALLSINNSDIDKIQYPEDFWGDYVYSLSQYHDLPSQTKLFTLLIDKFFNEYYTIQYFYSFIEQASATRFIVEYKYLEKVIACLNANMNKESFSENYLRIFSFITNLFEIDSIKFQPFIISLLSQIYDFLQGDQWIYFDEFSRISQVMGSLDHENFIYDFYLEKYLNISSRLMIEVLFGPQSPHLCFANISKLVNSAVNVDKVNIILNLGHYNYKGRFDQFSKNLLSETPLDLADHNINIDCLFKLILLASDIYSSNISLDLSNEIIARISKETISKVIIDNIITYIENIFKHFCLSEGPGYIVKNEQFLNSIINSINNLRNDSSISNLLDFIYKKVDMLSYSCLDEFYGEIFYDHVLQEINIISQIYFAGYERLTWLKSDYPKTELSKMKKALKTLEKHAISNLSS